ncbi:hypothetical protein F4680DRAFT_289185 [Xylaria scruposa]|nr:hypothetical protein F4680DRAFT_289185 [Xylaria scruposa]
MIDHATSAFWHPPWLRKPVLFAFVTLFIIFSAGLILMWYLINHYNGIPLTLTTNHYAWTYGPTAIFTVVLSLWRQVNYCTMVNQPWHELYHGPQDAAKTVLLDYIWPLQITSFATALKNRHRAVATTILIFTLLKLVMVISTTLFVLGDSFSSQDIRAQLLTKFDAANYLNSTRLVTSDPVWDYLDLREEYRNTDPPLELSKAFTNYSISSKIPRGAEKTSVQVSVFEVNATCETTTVDWSQNGPAKSFNLTLNTPSCDMGRIEVAACSTENAAFCGSGARYFQSGLVGCNGQGYAAVKPGDARVTTDEYRLAIVTIESDLTLVSEPETWPSNFSVNVRRIAAVSCGLEYSINQGVAHGPAFDTKIDSLEITDGQQSQIDNLTGLEVLDAIVVSASNSSATNHSYSITLMYNDCLDLLGLLTDSRTITPTTFDPLLDILSLKSKAEETLTGLSHQLMRRYFFLPDNTTTSGSVNYTEQKLYTRAAALWTMVGLLAVISCLVLVVAAYSKQGVAPRSPVTLSNAAYIMSRSPTMGKLLGEYTAIRLSDIRKTLANYDFVTVRDRAGMPRVEAMAVTREESLPKSTTQTPNPKTKKKRAWMPYSSHSHAIALTLLLPTTAIAALEILQYLSENNEHFITVSSDSSIATYAIRYSSTAIVLIISTLFNTLDFAIATMTSFSALAIGDVTAERTMLFAIVGDLPPVALYKAIYHTHIGAALSLLASTVGSLLTIAISGLWVDTAIKISQDIIVEVQSDWDIRFTEKAITFNYETSEGTIALFNDVEHGFPDKTNLIWGNVVLPRVGNPQLSTQLSSTSQLKETLNGGTPQYNIAVPAVRPFLECSSLPPSAMFITLDTSSLAYPPIRTFGATTALPAGCVDAYSSGEQAKTISIWHTIMDNTTSGWIGLIFDLRVILSSDKAPAEGCPSLGAIFGTYEGVKQPHSNITTLICTQHLQSVEANVTYPGDMSSLFTPNLTTYVRLNSPPPRNIIDAQSGGTSLRTRISDSFRNLEFIEPIDDTINFDPFFSRLLNGPRGTNRENLIGRENVDTLIAATNDLYQRFMVRVLDLDWRYSVGGENTTQPTQPTPGRRVARGSITVSASRLKLNKTSKIVLQTLLGTMVLLGGIAWWCVDMRVLPRNPYPIASTMALFAGSRLIGASGQAPNGIREQEQPWKIKRKPLVIVKGRRFRLGWWEDSGAAANNGSDSDSVSQALLPTAGRRFGIDVEDKDKAVSSTVSKTNTVIFRRWLR